LLPLCPLQKPNRKLFLDKKHEGNNSRCVFLFSFDVNIGTNSKYSSIADKSIYGKRGRRLMMLLEEKEEEESQNLSGEKLMEERKKIP
jgi:hypothetical protein